jgi:hypothetical protein
VLNTEAPSRLTTITITERKAAEEHDVMLDPRPSPYTTLGRRLVTGQFAQ